MTMAKGRYSSFQELERDANYQCRIKYGNDAKAMKLNPDSWDAEKFVGCLCDKGYRGLDCSKKECKSYPDVMKGPGNGQGRECSGRGICNYITGQCLCFEGFTGIGCESFAIKKFVL
jgi:hypothetical protein